MAWARFIRAWDWNLPGTRISGRYTKHFPAGVVIRLTRGQFQSAMAAGVIESTVNPRHAASTEGTANVDYLGGDLDPGRGDFLGINPGGRSQGD